VADVLQIARARILRHLERRGVIRVDNEALSVDDRRTETRQRLRCGGSDSPGKTTDPATTALGAGTVRRACFLLMTAA